ncbi:uncharacterized protein si:ch211-81a5.8 [Brachionichthys hirsutus]|uniref:uncharacterized protein si:ch211-81a5.8 n=1 Tax=Brachionichthys hirsutus TaxID=412623 RepID=UPI0036049C63
MDSLTQLGAPLKQLTSCVMGKKTTAKRSQAARRSSFTRRRSVSRRRSLPCSSQKVPDSWMRLYQEELKRERKRQRAVLAKKHAERSVRKTHFRSHHCLPRQAARSGRPAAAKDDSFFGAFQGLSLDGLMGDGSRSAPRDQCKVM